MIPGEGAGREVLSFDPPPPHLKKSLALTPPKKLSLFKHWKIWSKNGILLANPQDFHKSAVKFDEIS
jgi:hypothetical protein